MKTEHETVEYTRLGDHNRKESRIADYTKVIWTLASVLSLIIIALSIWGLILNTGPRNCGKSASEAKRNRCRFDLLAAAWKQPACFEAETESEYRAWIFNPVRKSGTFPYYRSDSKKDPFKNVQELSEWTGQAYTTNEEHLGHCSFVAIRLHRLLLSGKGLNKGDRFYSTVHTDHCSAMLRMAMMNSTMDHAQLTTEFGISFEKCE